MTYVTPREKILEHENDEYIETLKRWTKGRIPGLCDYRKISVDSFEEAYKLAKLGQEVTCRVFPNFKGEPLYLYFTQSLLVGAAIITRDQAEKLGLDFDKYRVVLMVTVSRYGKSFVNGAIAAIKAAVEGREVIIGGASIEKAGIIQNKVITLLPYAMKEVQDGLETNKDEIVSKKIQRLTTQVNKQGLMWRNGGSIKLFSTNEAKKNTEVSGAGAVGMGGDFCILDEIQLMTPAGFNTAKRFIMENENTKLFCVGNPQINGHFKELYDDPGTFVVHANDCTAIIEGRMTRRDIDLTGLPSYSPEYRAFCQVEFPDERTGTRFFTTLPAPYNEEVAGKPLSKQYFIGIDSAYNGGDSLMVTLLSLNTCAGGKKYVLCEEQIDLKKSYPEWQQDTTTKISLDILRLWQDKEAISGCIDIGQGIHIYEAMLKLDGLMALEPINFASKPTSWRMDTDFAANTAANVRAEMHLDLKDLCEKDLLYIAPSCHEQIIKEMREIGGAVETTSSKTRIELKKEIKRRLGRSPDCLDSLCLAVHAMVLSGVLTGGNHNETMGMEVL